jgi:tripeptidyl-peptidase-1
MKIGVIAALCAAAVLPSAALCARPVPAGARVPLETGHTPDPTGAYRLLDPSADPRGYVEPTTMLRLTAAVRLNAAGVTELEDRFWRVSDPKSADYGRHMSLSEVDDLTAPAPQAVRRVIEWLEEHSGARVVDTAARGGFVIFEAPVQTVEFMLGCRVAVYEHLQLDRTVMRAVNGFYTVPEHVAEHLDFVGGLSQFPHLGEIVRRETEKKRLASTSAPPPDFGITVDPSLLRNHYNSHKLTGDFAKNGVMQSITALIGQYFSETSLEAFNVGYAHYNIGHGISKIIGPNMQSNEGVEAALDTQYMTAMAPHTNTWFWSIDAASQDPFLEWIGQIANTTKPPQVHSTSYGGAESGIPEAYAMRLDTEFQKAGVRGLSLLFASGDGNVGCSASKKTFEPDWPASSTYVTAVGATTMSLPLESGSEIVAPFSGSGSSNRYVRPRYQEAAVASYLANKDANLPAQSFWNSTGRMYPDVSALGMNYRTWGVGADFWLRFPFFYFSFWANFFYIIFVAIHPPPQPPTQSSSTRASRAPVSPGPRARRRSLARSSRS